MAARGLQLANHPSLLAFTPTPDAAVLEHFAAKQQQLSLKFAHLIGSLLLLFSARQGMRPGSGSMAALPFDILVQVIYHATGTVFNVSHEQVYALLELISAKHAAIRARLRSKDGRLAFIERERAQTVNGKLAIRVQLDLWPPLD